MAEHNRIGEAGEKAAVAFLRKKGYRILHQNYRYRRAEIDIIARKGKTLVFVEVKTRETDLHGWPEEAVTWKKRKLLLQTADHFIHHTDWLHEIRFDIIAITGTGPTPQIHHIEDAFH
jgi:putative endonuclease